MRCLREAHCVFNKGYSDLSVLVRNMSATGAKLTGDELLCLPDEFELQINDGGGGFTSHWVRRAWLRGDAIGVTFIDPPGGPAEASAAPVRRSLFPSRRPSDDDG